MKKNSSRHGLEVSVEIVIPMKKGIKIKKNKILLLIYKKHLNLHF